jgi:hypothetical protein
MAAIICENEATISELITKARTNYQKNKIFFFPQKTLIDKDDLLLAFIQKHDKAVSLPKKSTVLRHLIIHL